MNVFTSYYDKVPELDKNAYAFVRVSRREPPDFFVKIAGDYVDLSDSFGPPKAMLAECHPSEKWEEFEPRYKKEVLGALDKTSVLDEFRKIYNEHGCRPLLLLCTEASGKHCHRHLIADFLGIEIKEL